MSNILFYNSRTNPEMYFMSNFYPHLQPDPLFKLKHNGKTYKTSEALYAALKIEPTSPDYQSKADEFIDHIRVASTPTKALYLGRFYTFVKYSWHQPLQEIVKKYEPYVKLKDNWEDERYDIMKFFVSQKFKQNPHLMKRLLKTKGSVLGEQTSSYWGYGGSNALGNILMSIRDETS